MEALIILLSVLCIISIIIGVWSFRKYKETKNNNFLFLFILFTFVILGVLIVIIFRLHGESGVDTGITCYMMVKTNMTGMVIGRKEFIEKFKNKLPKNIYDRLSKKN